MDETRDVFDPAELGLGELGDKPISLRGLFGPPISCQKAAELARLGWANLNPDQRCSLMLHRETCQIRECPVRVTT